MKNQDERSSIRTLPVKSSRPSAVASMVNLPAGSEKVQDPGPKKLRSTAPAAVVPLAQELSQKRVLLRRT